MAGKKWGAIIAAKTPGSYFALSETEQSQPGSVIEELMQKYAGKVEFLRRYWTRAFTAEATDVFVVECDDPMDLHNFYGELMQGLAAGGVDPDRFGVDVKIYFGANPDAEPS